MLIYRYMVQREYWIKRIEEGWEKRSVVWLSGVRRIGKTYLTRSLQEIEYFDCELPRVRRMMEDSQSFLEGLKGKRIVLDEIHRLENPSELLKISADHYKDIHILATGSSTLGATRKFKDTLTGRKFELWLTPLMSNDLEDFGNTSLPHRFLHGGLPPFFLENQIPEKEYQEWMDAFWAKDIQELFRIERKYPFQKFFELIMAGSGGIFEATRYAAPCEVSRSTISNYLQILESTFVVHVIRPFSSHKVTEIVSAPKVYGLDTGFICYHRGWDTLRKEDLGYLWEHYVLNELQAQLQTRKINYWRDKRGHEIDFIWLKRGHQPITIECKWSAGQFDPAGVKAFRHQYPQGENFLVAPDVDRPYSKHYDDIQLQCVNLSELVNRLKNI